MNKTKTLARIQKWLCLLQVVTALVQFWMWYSDQNANPGMGEAEYNLMSITYLVSFCANLGFAIEGYLASLLFDFCLCLIYSVFLIIQEIFNAWFIGFTIYFNAALQHKIVFSIICILGIVHLYVSISLSIKLQLRGPPSGTEALPTPLRNEQQKDGSSTRF